MFNYFQPTSRCTLLSLTIVLVTMVLAGCSTPVTEYGDSQAVETVTNEFGSSDLQQIAESMTRSLLISPVIGSHRPIVTVAEVHNSTNEYIDTRSITESIRAQLLKSGSVKFAVDLQNMDSQKAELQRQTDAEYYDQPKAKQKGRMIGADYRLEGAISSIIKKAKRIEDVYYKFSLQLIDIETGLVEWADEKEIRKVTKK